MGVTNTQAPARLDAFNGDEDSCHGLLGYCAV